MESLFFGPSAASLYGVYCPARLGRERPEGIVFCYPQGQEYMRAHRALRQLALNLADQGYHVLRFDYRGTGDSAGDMDDIVLDHWIEDTLLAVAELRDMAALSRVALVGLRLGGTVAAEAACAAPDISRLVLWDPVCDGQAYIEGLRTALPRMPVSAAQSNFIAPDETIHLNGFPLPLPLQQSVTTRQLAALDTTGLQSILQLASHETPEFSALRQAWKANEAYQFRLEPAPHDWNYVDNFGSILLPQPIMTAIRSWFE